MRDARFTAAALATAAGLVAAPVVIARAPLERVMGPIQKIFYFHVPVCWILMISTLVLGGASLRFLVRPSPRSEALAQAAAELGVVFGIGALVSGPL
jgi:heme exporter protein C